MLMAAAKLCVGAEMELGARLPTLKGEFLKGGKAVLPEAAAGKIALLALGFTYDSRFAVEAWVKRFRAVYGENPRVTFYEIPMIGGMAQLGKWFIDSGMRRGTPKADQAQVITVYRGVGAWKEQVGYKDPDAAYLMLLDRTGIVRWRQCGKPDDASFQMLSGVVNNLLAKSQE